MEALEKLIRNSSIIRLKKISESLDMVKSLPIEVLRSNLLTVFINGITKSPTKIRAEAKANDIRGSDPDLLVEALRLKNPRYSVYTVEPVPLKDWIMKIQMIVRTFTLVDPHIRDFLNFDVETIGEYQPGNGACNLPNIRSIAVNSGMSQQLNEIRQSVDNVSAVLQMGFKNVFSTSNCFNNAPVLNPVRDLNVRVSNVTDENAQAAQPTSLLSKFKFDFDILRRWLVTTQDNLGTVAEMGTTSDELMMAHNILINLRKDISDHKPTQA